MSDIPCGSEPHKTIRAPYTVGVLVLGPWRRLLAHGRAHGLSIVEHPSGGWLERRGWLVVTGPSVLVESFLSRWAELAHLSEPELKVTR